MPNGGVRRRKLHLTLGDLKGKTHASAALAAATRVAIVVGCGWVHGRASDGRTFRELPRMRRGRRLLARPLPPLRPFHRLSEPPRRRSRASNVRSPGLEPG